MGNIDCAMSASLTDLRQDFRRRRSSAKAVARVFGLSRASDRHVPRTGLSDNIAILCLYDVGGVFEHHRVQLIVDGPLQRATSRRSVGVPRWCEARVAS